MRSTRSTPPVAIDTTSVRRCMLLAMATLAAPARFAFAQPQVRMVSLGVLTPDPREPDTATWRTFASELARLGWTEGRNLRVERRFVDMGRLDVLDRMARDLVEARVDVIYAAGGSATALAAKKATATVPIVFYSSADPVGMGLVSSLAHPGTNLTGSSIQSLDLLTKQFQLLRRVSRKLTSIAYINSADRRDSALSTASVAAASAAARALGVRIQFVYASSIDEVEPQLQRLVQSGVDGTVISGSASFSDAVLEKIAALLVAYRLPSLGGATEGFLLDRVRRRPCTRRGALRRQDPEGREAGRPARRSRLGVRIRPQSRDRQGAGPGHPARHPDPGHRRHSLSRRDEACAPSRTTSSDPHRAQLLEDVVHEHGDLRMRSLEAEDRRPEPRGQVVIGNRTVRRSDARSDVEQEAVDALTGLRVAEVHPADFRSEGVQRIFEMPGAGHEKSSRPDGWLSCRILAPGAATDASVTAASPRNG